jgi:IclR family transcriptional regulator, KDG regulon repressor
VDAYVVLPVRKALLVLEYVVSEGREVALTEVATRLRLPKTTCLRYLRTLSASGFLAHDASSDRYRAGEKWLSLARPRERSRLVERISPHMLALRDRFNETVNLARLDGGDVIYHEIVESRRSLRMQARVGARDSASTTALGKALLATLPVERQPIALRAELRRVRERGWATDHGENEDDSWCVGVALTGVGLMGVELTGESGDAIAALSISAPASRMNATLERAMADALIEAASALRVGGQIDTVSGDGVDLEQ